MMFTFSFSTFSRLPEEPIDVDSPQMIEQGSLPLIADRKLKPEQLVMKMLTAACAGN